jgi:hypothetical protein
MSANWLEWVTGVASVLTIIWFGLYLRERCKRKNQDTLMLYFLHGVKSLVETMSKRDTTTGADWQSLLSQINDMLARLQPPKRARRVYKPEPSNE